METAKICSFTSHLHDMQNILATAVLTILAETPLSHSPNKLHWAVSYLDYFKCMLAVQETTNCQSATIQPPYIFLG